MFVVFDVVHSSSRSVRHVRSANGSARVFFTDKKRWCVRIRFWTGRANTRLVHITRANDGQYLEQADDQVPVRTLAERQHGCGGGGRPPRIPGRLTTASWPALVLGAPDEHVRHRHGAVPNGGGRDRYRFGRDENRRVDGPSEFDSTAEQIRRFAPFGGTRATIERYGGDDDGRRARGCRRTAGGGCTDGGRRRRPLPTRRWAAPYACALSGVSPPVPPRRAPDLFRSPRPGVTRRFQSPVGPRRREGRHECVRAQVGSRQLG